MPPLTPKQPVRDAAGDVHAAVHRSRHDRSRETVCAVVGDARRVIVVVKWHHYEHRVEDFFLCDRRAVVHADDHGGCDVMTGAEVSRQVIGLTPTDGYRCAVAACPLDGIEYAALLCGADHRADKGFRRCGIANRHGRVCRRDIGDRVVVQRPVDQHPGGRRARLPGVHTESWTELSRR
jgi:hypothetical protein